MKVLILASGTGSRLLPYTETLPKCLVPIGDTVILERQLEAFSSLGIHDIIITTGPFAEKIQEFVRTGFPELRVRYIYNEIYASTNYIYSMYKCKEFIDDDFILVHGDLLFDASIVQDLIKSDVSHVVMNKTIPLPEKDFKGQIVDGKVSKIGVNVNGEGAYFLAPLYFLKKNTFQIWMKEIEHYIKNGIVKCYAEDALNDIEDKQVFPYFYENLICEELDTLDDLRRMEKYPPKKQEQK